MRESKKAKHRVKRKRVKKKPVETQEKPVETIQVGSKVILPDDYPIAYAGRRGVVTWIDQDKFLTEVKVYGPDPSTFVMHKSLRLDTEND